jgi:hypothetical protein
MHGGAWASWQTLTIHFIHVIHAAAARIVLAQHRAGNIAEFSVVIGIWISAVAEGHDWVFQDVVPSGKS